ncbi:hypothetical protein [Rickettsia asembonensis]|uniref:Arp2/3 complex-activating protein rickA n=1 Tax=Rickettsia asembonensis TaxID=1068590 RepID=A0A0C2MN38_9RICK|nr:hypothetical protein [Rickettsia asembonensis]KIJ88626.1 Arp2/3 complex-activating protein rickA [Rickettsia asembonensis]WCR57521.1 MAG: hypothetical protein PG979_001578 [Rickettsia asembonensis]
MAKEIDINKLLAQENNALNTILSQVNELCEQNKKLQGLIEIQNETKELEKEHNISLPWFKRLVKTVSNVKYIFVKSEEQLTNEAIKYNNKILKDIDNKIYNIAEKFAPLKQELQEEIEKNFKDLTKKDLSKEQRERLLEVYFSYKSKPERFSALNMTNPLQFIKAEELEKQYNSLNATKQNIQNLISENSNIKELKEIQKRVAEIREEIPYTFFEKLNNIWQNVKSVFVNNSEQVLAKNKESNTRTIRKIDEQLYKTKHKFEELIENKEKDINAQASQFPKDMQYRVYNKLVDLKSNDLILPITQNETPSFATIKKPNQKRSNTTSLKVDIPTIPSNSESFRSNEPINDSISATEEVHKRLFCSESLPTAEELKITKPQMTFQSFRPNAPISNSISDTAEKPKILFEEISREEIDRITKLGSSINSHMSNSYEQYKDVASVYAAREAARSYSSSDSDSGFSSDVSTKPKTLKTRSERDATKVTQVQKVLSGRNSQKPSFVRS